MLATILLLAAIHKPVLVFYRTADCARCDAFERQTLTHPVIQRRLPNVDFAIKPGQKPLLALYDRNGVERARWPIVPDTTSFGIILDASVGAAARFDRAADLAGSSDADVELAIALARLGFRKDARAALERARDAGHPRANALLAALDNPRMRNADDELTTPQDEELALHIAEPREGVAGGSTRVVLDARGRVAKVTISWNDSVARVLTRPPWQATIDISNAAGVLRAVAEDADGHTTEDAVLLNAGAGARSDVQLVELPITLRGGGQIISIREGNKTLPIDSIAKAAETPLTIGLLFDVSSSMQKTLPDLQEAAIGLVTRLGANDRAFLVAFDSAAHLKQPATSDKSLLTRHILNLRPDGLTALNDALFLGLQQFRSIKGRRALIVFTDGIDRTSSHTVDDVRDLARRMNVPVHVIGVDDALASIARESGGTAHALANLDALPAAFADIEAALASQLIVYVRTDPATRDGEWRPIRVEATGPNVFAPAGYYASR